MILFRDDEIQTVYCSARDGAVAWRDPLTETIWVYYTAYQEELSDGSRASIQISKLQSYSDELWAACEQWQRDKAELEERYVKLKRGKVVIRQATLF